MKRLLAILLFIIPLAAQTGPTSVEACYAQIGDRSMFLHCTITACVDGYNFYLAYDYSEGTRARRSLRGDGGESICGRDRRVHDLTPDTDIFFAPVITNSAGASLTAQPCPVTCTNCTSADDAMFADDNGLGAGHSSINCVSGEDMRGHTLTLDSGAPVVPTAPTHSFSAVTPAATNTHVVDGTCSDIATHISAAISAANSGGTNERVLLPPNVRCPALQITNLTQGRVQFAPNVNAELLPPAGTRTHAGYFPHMALVAQDAGAASTTWDDPLVTCAASGHGYDFIGIRFAPPPGLAEIDIPTTKFSVVSIGDASCNQVRFDRIAIEYPTPWSTQPFLATNTDDIVIRDSDLFTEWTDELTTTRYSIYAHGSEDWQILNNSFRGEVIVFCDTSLNQCGDWTIKGNDFFVPDFHNGADPGTDGIYRHVNFCFEFKNAQRLLFQGNTIKGCRADFNLSGATINFSAISQQTRDIDIKDNVIHHSAGGIQFNTSNFAQRVIYPTQRKRISNNLFYQLDNLYCCSGTGCSTASCTTGQFLNNGDAGEDAIITRNTVHVARGQDPFMLAMGSRGQGHVDSKNIYVITEGTGGLKGGVRRNISAFGMLPAPSATYGNTAFGETFVRGTTADALSSWGDDILIPGIESSNAGVYATKAASTDTADTVCRHEISGDQALDGFTGRIFIGNTNNPCVESLNERLALVFDALSWRPISPTHDGYGADLDAIAVANGRSQNVQVTADADSATIPWDAPTSTGCKVQLAPWSVNYVGTFDDEAAIVEQTDVGGDTTQTVTFDSGTTGALSALTKYGYRIQCAKERFGNFTTGGS